LAVAGLAKLVPRQNNVNALAEHHAPTKDMNLTDEERGVLQAWTLRRSTPQRLVVRARIVLAIADGRSPTNVAREVGATRASVYKWLRRFRDRRIAGIECVHRPIVNTDSRAS